MGIKITASEHNVRLQRLPEDDTIFCERTISTFGNIVYVNRLSVTSTEAVFIIIRIDLRYGDQLFPLLKNRYHQK